MSIDRLLSQTATIIERSGSGSVDEYGDEVATETETEVACAIQQQRRDEEDDSELGTGLWRGYFPAGTDLDGGDAIRVEDFGTFELDGPPWPVLNHRTNQVSHVEATLNRTAGPEDAS